MKKKLILISLLIVLVVLTGCTTPETPETEVDESTLAISGKGTATTVPDIVDIQLGVDALSDNPQGAVSENAAKMNAIMAVMEEMGIAPEDIQTIYYNMWVEDIYDQNGQLTGEKRYRVTNQVNVRLRQLDQLGALLEDAIGAGATNINGITFGVADTTELEQTALQNAIANANEKATRIAGNLDMSLGKMINLSEGGFYSPSVPYYGEKVGIGGGAEVPISQGQFSVTVQVQVVYELTPQP
jgi:hypothetical protein